MKFNTVNIPSVSDLPSLLEQIDAKLEHLLLMEQGVSLNQQVLHLMSQRGELQHKSLRKMLNELQTLVHNLHELAAQRDEGSPMQ